jgi:ATP-dependent Lon protease
MSIIFNNIDKMSFDDLGEESEFIPLMTSEDEEALEKEVLPDVLSILPLTNTVLFPGVVMPINAGSDKSIKLINDANKSNKLIGVVAQKSPKVENPSIENIHEIGTVAKILRVLKMPDGNTTVIIQGKKRFKIKSVVKTDPYIQATIDSVNDKNEKKT